MAKLISIVIESETSTGDPADVSNRSFHLNGLTLGWSFIGQVYPRDAALINAISLAVKEYKRTDGS